MTSADTDSESDGERYLRWRSYQVNNDQTGAEGVMDTLSKDKRKALKQLQKHHQVATVFQKLEPYRGLWKGFILGRIRHILSWFCDDEICSYLETVLSVCKAITCEDPLLVSIIDTPTVELLELKCPKFSCVDQEKIRDAVRSKKIFAQLQDDRQRDQVLQRILSLDGVILTIGTFFTHSRYLEAVARLSKGICSEARISLRTSLQQYFCPQGSEQYVEVADGRGIFAGGLNFEKRFACAYLQLCLQAIRFKLRLKNLYPNTTETCMVSFAKLAGKVGFDSVEIREVKNEAEELVQHNLIGSVDEFDVAVAPVNVTEEQETLLLALFQKQSSTCLPPSFSHDRPIPKASPNLQCDANHLFLPVFQCDSHGTVGRFASSYCLLYYAIVAFYGEYLRTFHALSVSEISQNLRENGELITPLSLPLPQHTPGKNSCIELNEARVLAVPVNREQQDFAPCYEASSVYSSPPQTLQPSPLERLEPPEIQNPIEQIRTIMKKLDMNEVAFIKLETFDVCIVSLTWENISDVVIGIESGNFAGRKIIHSQIYGLVLNGRLQAFAIPNLEFEYGLLETADLRRVIFIVDRDSMAAKIFFSGQAFADCFDDFH